MSIFVAESPLSMSHEENVRYVYEGKIFQQFPKFVWLNLCYGISYQTEKPLESQSNLIFKIANIIILVIKGLVI